MWLKVILVDTFGKIRGSPKSFLDNRSHRKSTELGTSWRPLRVREGKTHLGNKKSFSQACSEFRGMSKMPARE